MFFLILNVALNVADTLYMLKIKTLTNYRTLKETFIYYWIDMVILMPINKCVVHDAQCHVL